MPDVRHSEPVASPFEDAVALAQFLDDLAAAQADGFRAEFETCGLCGMTFHPDCANCAGRAA